ncbi:hypothetical protein [Diaphorobacter sp. LR2014-1]|uniref:hypothetical protein n=1 Tax=Diaphorobacter sp. LR2014-1 TaxID=1933219 RepID=UPI000CDA666B|nr:hypothetical protein [Diaphorobacter sp. LR2014-1]
MLTYSMLFQILVEAEGRRDNTDFPQDVRDRSAETASLCLQRMSQEGLTRDQLEKLAKGECRRRRKCQPGT